MIDSLNWGKTRYKRALLLGSALVAGLLIGLLILTTGYMRHLRDIHSSWSAYSSNSEQKGALLGELKTVIGFGGVIHNFKNYLVRHEEPYRVLAADSIIRAHRIVHQYAELDLTPPERQALTDIHINLTQHDQYLDMVSRRIAGDWPIERIDEEVYVDDQIALTALNTLEQAWTWSHEAEVRDQEAALERGRQLAQWSVVIIVAVMVLGAAILLLMRRLVRHTASAAMLNASILHTVSEGILTTDLSGVITSFNPSAEKIFGFDAAEVVGKPVEVLLPSGSAARHPVLVEAFSTAGTSLSLTDDRAVHARRADGSEFPVEISIDSGALGSDKFFTVVLRDITKRREAERQLRESEERFRGFVESTPDFIWEVDERLRYSYASPAVADVLGYAPGELVGKSPFDFMTPDEADRIRDIVTPLIEDGTSIIRLQNTNIHKDGASVVLETSGVPILADDGRLLGYRGIDRDITDLVVAKETAARSRMRLHQAMEAIDEGFALFDAQGRLVMWNSRFAAFHRHAAETVTANRPFEDILRKGLDVGHYVEAVGREDDWLAERLKRFHAPSGPFLVPMTDGRVLRMLESPTPEGGTVCVAVDVTDLVTTEAKLIDSEQRYRLVVNGVNDGIWDWNIETDDLYVSSRFLQILGYDDGEVTLTPDLWESWIAPAHLEKHGSRLDDHFADRAPVFSCEYQIKRRDGELIWVLDRGVVQRDENGKPVRMAGSISNITERRLAEDDLRHSQKMAAVGQLAAGVAHEFNNILVSIGGFTEMARDSLDDAGSIDAFLAEIATATTKASGLTRDLLEFSRGRKGRAEPLHFDLNDLVDDAKSLLGLIAKSSAKIELERTPADGPLPVHVDPARMSQVVTNFIINARDALPEGGTITVGARVAEITPDKARRIPGARPGRFASLYVADTGTGMDDKTRQHIFEPFFSTKEVGKGTGLGLAVVHGIVEEAGGFISVDSELGQGTTFAIHLPLTGEFQAAAHTKEEN